VHQAGDGVAWTGAESLDVDQPHGKDYLQLNHIAKAVRKRMSQEHSTFADATVGGIHKPGGVAVLGMEEGTATVVADGTLRGRGLCWDLTSRLWCATEGAGVSTTGDWTLVQLHPDKQWGGKDVTWTGDHAFAQCVSIGDALYVDSSLDVSGNANISGDLSISGALYVDSSVDISGEVNISGDLSISGALYVDSTVDISGEVHISGDTDISGTLNLYKHYADNSGFVYLPGGIIYKWGVADNIPANNTVDVTFKTTEHNGAYTNMWNVHLTELDYSNSSEYIGLVAVIDYSNTGFRIANSADHTSRVYWCTIGN